MKNFDKVWINNLSTSTKTPLLTLSIEITEEQWKKSPLHIVQQHKEEDTRYTIVLSFLQPEDLDKLQEAIEIAKVAKLNNDTMVKLWHDANDKKIVYAVGMYDGHNGFGMAYGPNPELKDMLSTYPKVMFPAKDYQAFEIYIMKFEDNPDEIIKEPIPTELYIWNKKLEEWIEI